MVSTVHVWCVPYAYGMKYTYGTEKTNLLTVSVKKYDVIPWKISHMCTLLIR